MQRFIEQIKRTVLVIEDNEINREILVSILEPQYRILEAENGREGLTLLEENKDSVSLIMLDIQMPVMNGYEFLDAVKDEPAYSGIPIIVTTSSAAATDEIKCLENGAVDFVSKPYNPEVVLRRAERIIRFRETAMTIDRVERDPITGFYNKDFFFVNSETILAEQTDKQHDMLCIRINSFKVLEDRFGAERLNGFLRDLADVIRVKYAEMCIFGVLENHILAVFGVSRDIELHAACVKEIRAAIRQLSVPNATISVGLYKAVDTELPVAAICDDALLAIEEIRYQSGGQMAEYDEKIKYKLIRQQMIADMMEEAVEQEQFVVYYQAKHLFSDGTCGGAEALVRWNHPEFGFINPGEFIPLFEKNGFITRLDYYVLEHVCRDLQQWIKGKVGTVPISFNLSRVDFEDEHLVENVIAIVDRYAVPHELVHLEVTESAYVTDEGGFLAAISAFHKNGFLIELDDFGTGYSSLSVLNDLDIDVLKLDMSLVRKLDSERNMVILTRVVDMAKTLGIAIVAEGVETEEQVEKLRSMGCHYAQGYYFAKPQPKDQFAAVLPQHAAGA